MDIVTIMLLPQSLAYAMLADPQLEVGLYSSVLPMVVSAIWVSAVPWLWVQWPSYL